jgi:hypothetical protein
MGNKDKSQNRRLIDQENQRLQNENSQYKSMYDSERATERGVATGQRDDIYGGYKKLTDPSQYDSFFGYDKANGLSGGGGYTPQRYNPVTAATERAATERAGLSGYTSEAGAGYRKLSQDGGYSDSDISNIRSRATSVVPSFYESIRNNMARKATSSGLNSSSIFAGATNKLNRQQAEAGQSAALDAELGIGDRVREGKMAGLAGLTGVGGQENELNMFNAGQGNNVNMFNAGQGNEMNRYNTGTLNDAEMYNINEANSAAASGAAGQRAAHGDAIDAAERRERAYLTGLGGMFDMYESSPGELSRYDDMTYRNRGMGAENIGNNINQRISNSQLPSGWDRAMQGIGAVSGLAGAFGGFPSMGGGSKSMFRPAMRGTY